MRILSEIPLKPKFRKLYGQTLGFKIRSFMLQAWKEMPELVALTPAVFLSAAIAYYTIWTRDFTIPPRYFRDNTIYRPDDPRVPRINRSDSIVLERPITGQHGMD
ncbi:PREDICTED: uncharacterized protein LOC107186615 [Dufourea novaeangliae]|uniref:Uncharacterized protein n=1 Tax=Dufourea novaeangliae TaxID=178035 RepID=A0A154P930_DUFNO|nr:PREDICTED: uncharacterized protein LOC107186615 [Dufourea novaeangliae]KZC08347.1 hypothetical protein WN55_09251 [Dufourea novaeangliae]